MFKILGSVITIYRKSKYSIFLLFFNVGLSRSFSHKTRSLTLKKNKMILIMTLLINV